MPYLPFDTENSSNVVPGRVFARLVNQEWNGGIRMRTYGARSGVVWKVAMATGSSHVCVSS